MLAAACAALVSGCAAQNYGRLSPVDPLEAKSLGCAGIDADLVRVTGFLDQVRSGASWLSIAAAGPANGRERDAARRSAEQRRSQLLDARKLMSCPIDLHVPRVGA